MPHTSCILLWSALKGRAVVHENVLLHPCSQETAFLKREIQMTTEFPLARNFWCFAKYSPHPASEVFDSTVCDLQIPKVQAEAKRFFFSIVFKYSNSIWQ